MADFANDRCAGDDPKGLAALTSAPQLAAGRVESIQEVAEMFGMRRSRWFAVDRFSKNERAGSPQMSNVLPIGQQFRGGNAVALQVKQQSGRFQFARAPRLAACFRPNSRSRIVVDGNLQCTGTTVAKSVLASAIGWIVQRCDHIGQFEFAGDRWDRADGLAGDANEFLIGGRWNELGTNGRLLSQSSGRRFDLST